VSKIHSFYINPVWEQAGGHNSSKEEEEEGNVKRSTGCDICLATEMRNRKLRCMVISRRSVLRAVTTARSLHSE
jgi:hypothetical protein